MFGPASSWSFTAHMYMVSAWSATCPVAIDPMSCRPDANPEQEARAAWTDITDLLHDAGVSWGYYVFEGREPDCVENEEWDCDPGPQSARTPSYWNPLPLFTTVQENGQVGNVQPVRNFFESLRRGRLPAVSWVIPGWNVSEHPLARISRGQAWVTTVVNAVMRSRHWRNSAIFVSWDDWGGYYDHVLPPAVDSNGYGLRVPGLVISPYARRGVIDHQTLSHDAYLKFIQDVFLDGQRLDPATMKRPDSRPVVRETLPLLGDVRTAFDFDQPPRRPLLLRTRPPDGPGPGPVRAALRAPAVHRGALARRWIDYRLRCADLCSPRASMRLDGAPIPPTATQREDIVLQRGTHRLRVHVPATVLAGLERGERATVRLRLVVRGQAGWSRVLERRIRIVA
jgi:phospholipase C